LSIADHPDNLGKQGVAAHPFRAKENGARCVDRASRHTVARGLLDGNRLSGHHRLVNRRAAFNHQPVDGHFLAWPNPQHVADVRPKSRTAP
jgi:hypothetical protein